MGDLLSNRLLYKYTNICSKSKEGKFGIAVWKWMTMEKGYGIMYASKQPAKAGNRAPKVRGCVVKK